MRVSGIYSRLCNTLSAVSTAQSPGTVWANVKHFATAFECHHVVALDNDRLPKGLSGALLFSDATREYCEEFDRNRLFDNHPFEIFAREKRLPFLVSDVRKDERFQGQPWEAMLSEPVREGDAFVTPIHTGGTLKGAAVFAGRDIRDSSVARSSLSVVAHAAFGRVNALQQGNRPRNMAALTARELDCLQMLARGMPDDQIARVVGISRRTVRYHVDHAKQKLGVNSRVHAVAAAVHRGMITL